MTARLALILGGARSGKSVSAERQVARWSDVLYVATLLPGDDAAGLLRIAAHRARRPSGWHTVTVAQSGDVAATLQAVGSCDAVLLDGFELSLALADPQDDGAAVRLARAAAEACQNTARALACIVSAEVGLGVHPSSPAGSAFRDRLGVANQAIAALADDVVLVVAGLTVPLKGNGLV